MTHGPISPRTVAKAIAALTLVVAGFTASADARSRVVPRSLPLPDPFVDRDRQWILELEGDNVHNVGNILMHVTNFGLIGSLPNQAFPYSGAPSLQWPKGTPTEYLFAGGLWVGAIANGERRVTTAVQFANSDFIRECFPGRSELDRIYRTREMAPGGARRPAPNADDDRDGSTDEDWLNGRDDDGDGRIDEDFAAISNQMFFCEYGDYDPALRLRFPEHKPLDIQVTQSSFAWETPLIDDFIAFDYTIASRSIPLDDVYVGFYADFDIGPREGENQSIDDYAGFWEGVVAAPVGDRVQNVKVSIGYMWDDDTDEGESAGYVGILFLGAQSPNDGGVRRSVALRNSRFFSGDASFDDGGDPTNDDECYRVLDGSAPRSLQQADPVTGFRPAQTARRIGDYRTVVSAGPFSVGEAQSLQFQAAIVVGRGFDGLIENAAQAQLTYDGAWLDCDLNPSTGVDGRETALCPPEFVGTFCADACDTTCVTLGNCNSRDPRCGVTITESCEYVNADCEQEIENGERTGIEGRECLIHWLSSTPPPPPTMRLEARENRVDVLWDNRSEMSPDLRLAVIDFESYRIWRADGWTRPFGTNEATGPGASLWSLLAEYDLGGNRIGGDTGLEAIRYQPAIPDNVIQYYREWQRAHPFLQPPDLPGFTDDQLDTAQAVARGVRYYRYTDPPFRRDGCGPGGGSPCLGPPCGADGDCPTIQTSAGPAPSRCNGAGRCQATLPPPHSGAHYFYSVTATDHALLVGQGGAFVPSGPGLSGDPNSSFVYVNPPTNALPAARASEIENEVYVVPNPATAASMAPWTLAPNNDDPTGIKIEFHHLPQATGTVSVFTLSGDLVKELRFDGTSGNGSLAWDLVSRNGQDVTSGVYLFAVESDGGAFERFVGRFVVIR